MISVSVARGLIQSTENIAKYELEKEKRQTAETKHAGQHNWLERLFLGVKH